MDKNKLFHILGINHEQILLWYQLSIRPKSAHTSIYMKHANSLTNKRSSRPCAYRVECNIFLCRNENSFKSFLRLVILSFRWSGARTLLLRCPTATACSRWSSATWRLSSTASPSSRVFSSGPLRSYSLSTTMTGSTTSQKVTKVQWGSE